MGECSKPDCCECKRVSKSIGVCCGKCLGTLWAWSSILYQRIFSETDSEEDLREGSCEASTELNLELSRRSDTSDMEEPCNRVNAAAVAEGSDVEELYRRANATALVELSENSETAHIVQICKRALMEELYKRASVSQAAESSEASESTQSTDIEELHKRANAKLMKDPENKDELENTWMSLKQTRVKMEKKMSGAYMIDRESKERYGL